MNITDIIPGQQVIAQTHETGCPINEFPARFLGTAPTEAGTVAAVFLFQPAGTDVWHNFTAHALTPSGPWTVGNMLLTVRAEQYVTIAELAEQIAWDGVASDELVCRIVEMLGMDPAHVGGETLVGEDAAERVANEITVTV